MKNYYCHAQYWPWGTSEEQGDASIHYFRPASLKEATKWFDSLTGWFLKEVTDDNDEIIMKESHTAEDLVRWKSKVRLAVIK
jgi:hypothetical protein